MPTGAPVLFRAARYPNGAVSPIGVPKTFGALALATLRGESYQRRAAQLRGRVRGRNHSRGRSWSCGWDLSRSRSSGWDWSRSRSQC